MKIISLTQCFVAETAEFTATVRTNEVICDNFHRISLSYFIITFFYTKHILSIYLACQNRGLGALRCRTHFALKNDMRIYSCKMYIECIYSSINGLEGKKQKTNARKTKTTSATVNNDNKQCGVLIYCLCECVFACMREPVTECG